MGNNQKPKSSSSSSKITTSKTHHKHHDTKKIEEKTNTSVKQASNTDSDDSDDDSEESSSDSTSSSSSSSSSDSSDSSDSSSSSSDSSDDDSDYNKSKPITKSNAINSKSKDSEEFSLSTLKSNTSKTSANKSTVESSSAPSTTSARDSVRIFVGNLPFSATDESVAQFFQSCGEIASIHWVTDKQTGQWYGTAFIEFTTPKGAESAQLFNGRKMSGRPIKVGQAVGNASTANNKKRLILDDADPNATTQPIKKLKAGAHIAALPISEKPGNTRTVFLGNLSFNIDEETVRNLFSKCDEIMEVRWVEKDSEFKGCGFVVFKTTEGTDEAVKLNGRIVMGRPIRVDYSSCKYEDAPPQ
jgi:nucleolin